MDGERRGELRPRGDAGIEVLSLISSLGAVSLSTDLEVNLNTSENGDTYSSQGVDGGSGMMTLESQLCSIHRSVYVPLDDGARIYDTDESQRSGF